MATTLAIVITHGLTADTAQAEPRQPIIRALAAHHTTQTTYMGYTALEWAKRYRHQKHRFQVAKTHLRKQWRPTVLYALKLASAVTGVSYWQLYSVSRCESGHNPFAQNGQYKGLFQMHWLPFGFSPFDPVANALSAAMTVRHDGSWRQWSCKP